MIEGSTCDDLSFSAPKLVTPEGDALPSHRQRVGENRRRCVFGDKRCGKNAPKKGCICTHSRALPRDDHHLLGVHKARSSARGPRQLSAPSTGSRRRWEAELNSIKDARTKADGPRLDGAATPAGAEEGKVAVNAILELAIV